MTNLDVSNSSTDSSSGSTSDSSSSESSSSSSGSASSSSDSESSTDTPPTTAPPPKSPTKPEEPKKKDEPKQRRPSKVKISSSSEDEAPKSTSPLPPRRRASAKTKAAAAVLTRGKTGPRLPAGAKTPKSNSKTVPKSNKSDSGSHKKKSIFSPDNSSESDSESKSSKSTKDSPKSKHSSHKSSEELSIPIQLDNDDSNSKDSNSKDSKVSKDSKDSTRSNQSKDSTHSKDSKDSNHSKDSKDSIRSNLSKDSTHSTRSNLSKDSKDSTHSTRSNHSKDSATPSKASTTNSKASTTASKTSTISKISTLSKLSSSKASLSNSKTSSSKDSGKRKNGNKPNGPPPKRLIEDKSASSCTSSQSSVESVTDSDSDSEPTLKKEPVKTGKTKPPSNSSKEATGKSGDSGDSQGAVTRKLTRSLSARASRLAPAARHTDTDSELDEKPTLNQLDTKSKDYKKSILKGRGAVGRSPIKPPASPPDIKPPGERMCPVRGCDSSGHLGGKSIRHFTYDACPLYHNVTPAACVAAGEERAAAGAARRRALLQLQQRPRAVPSLDQRAYQLKVKDMRSKWKGSQELKDRLAASGNDELNDDREPILDGFAPDYDLKLFREAQALAAIKIEEELGDLPSNRGTRFVVMGKYMMEVWYQSPYPGAAARVPRLFVCEFCLNHHKSACGARRHRDKCPWRHPPGDEVYRKDNLSVWQVDGRKHKQYCQQLCLLAKFFLDHKTLYYDVEPFLFYVMTCADDEGCHIVGCFSKGKNSFQNYNVSCILTLPPYQRQGYGRLLIDFSYLLTKVEGKVGSPETPLSDLGLISYRSYWKEALLKRLCSAPGSALCIRDLSKDLAIASSDIVSTLQERGLMKYWKGKHIVLKKQEVLEEVSRRAARARCVDPLCLRWWVGAPPPR